MSISKTKIKGNEYRYSNSLNYEWYVKFKDNTSISMFTIDGNENQLYTAYEYQSPIVEIGITSLSQAKADMINENKSHEYTVIASNNLPISITDIPIKNPYVMRRKTKINLNIEWVYIIGSSDKYIMIRDRTGENKIVPDTLSEW